MNVSSDSGFILAESVRRNSFEDDVYAHLSALAAVEFSRPGSPAQAGTFRFDAVKYEALEQAAFEEAARIEAEPPQPVRWSEIDERVTAFEGRLVDSIGRDPQAGNLVPYIRFSAKCYENYLAYRDMYPRSNGSNPWARTVSVLRYGRMLVIDDESRLERVRRPNADVSRDASNLGVLVKGAPTRPAMMSVDDRFTLQSQLLSLLKQNAVGHENKLSLRVIADMLEALGTKLTVPTIQIRLTTPLKKAGVIGSNSKGFFFIQSEADLIESYCFHRTKVQSADKIMRRYAARARDMNVDLNLEDECSGGTVLNRRLP